MARHPAQVKPPMPDRDNPTVRASVAKRRRAKDQQYSQYKRGWTETPLPRFDDTDDPV